MCIEHRGWTPEANVAKSVAIAALIFAIVDLLIEGFAGGIAPGITACIGALISIIATSMIVCCGPPSAGAGKGCIFRATGILALIASMVHMICVILHINANIVMIGPYGPPPTTVSWIAFAISAICMKLEIYLAILSFKASVTMDNAAVEYTPEVLNPNYAVDIRVDG